MPPRFDACRLRRRVDETPVARVSRRRLPRPRSAGPVARVAALMSTDEMSVIVVSGLPRSGTSMVMRMLGAGGVQLVVDGVRRPDEDNPLGYFEFEPVRSEEH